MPIQSSTFKTIEVRLHLYKRYPYAGSLFTQDTIGQDTVTAAFVQKWFKSYFPSGVSEREYRALEANVTQYMEIA